MKGSKISRPWSSFGRIRRAWIGDRASSACASRPAARRGPLERERIHPRREIGSSRPLTRIRGGESRMAESYPTTTPGYLPPTRKPVEPHFSWRGFVNPLVIHRGCGV